MKNRIISLVMVLALVFTLLPVYAIADVSTAAKEDVEVDPDMALGKTVEIQTMIESIKKALNSSDSLEQLKALLPKLEDFYLPELIDGLGTQDASAFIEKLKALLNGNSGEDSAFNSGMLETLLGLFVTDNDFSGLLKQLSPEQLKALLEKYLKDGTLDDLKNLIPEDSLKELLDKLMGDKNFEDLFGGIDTNKLLDALKGLFGGSGDGSFNIDDLLNGLNSDTLKQLLEKFDIEQLKALLDKLLDGNFDIDELLGKLDSETLKQLLEKLDVEQLKDILDKLLDGNFDIDELLGKLDSDTLKQLLEKLDVQQLQELLEKLMGGDFDINDLLGDLSTDKLIELFKQLMGDSDTLKDLLAKLNSGELGDILDKLLNGGFDINGLFKNLDTYSILKAIAGLIGSDLDVTGPKDVTVDEGKSATFSVKVNTAGTYKYMWIEPGNMGKTDLSGIDLSGLTGSKLELGMKLLQALKNLPNLSTKESYTIEKTTASDNGRTFACLIYNVSDLKNVVLYVTDEAKLTVNAAAEHKHTPVVVTPAVEPTCVKAGCTEGTKCSECGETLSESKVLPATGKHTYVYKVCTVCKYEIPFPFVDVKTGDWFYGSVKYVWQHDIMQGISDTQFAPYTSTNRAMFATVLYRMAGSPDVKGMTKTPFTDIGASNLSWAYDAIVWAYNTGVVKGTSATTFSPNEAISRQDLVTMLYRYSSSPSVSGSLLFKDASAVGAYARNAVIWASTLGIVQGYGDGKFGPADETQRCQMAAILQRYMALTSEF